MRTLTVIFVLLFAAPVQAERSFDEITRDTQRMLDDGPRQQRELEASQRALIEQLKVLNWLIEGLPWKQPATLKGVPKKGMKT